MADLKAIQIQGNVTLIFDADYSVNTETSKTETLCIDSIDTFMNGLIDAGKFSAEEQENILSMSVKDFMDLCHKAEQRTSEDKDPTHTGRPKVPRQTLLMAPSKVPCPQCGALSLRIVDGFLSCAACGQDYGDVDLLPDLF